MKKYLVTVETVTRTVYGVIANSPDEARAKYEDEGGVYVENETPDQDESIGTVVSVEEGEFDEEEND